MRGDDKRRLKDDLKYTEEELRRLDLEERQREEHRELRVDEGLQPKSKIARRPLYEEQEDSGEGGKKKLSGDPDRRPDKGILGVTYKDVAPVMANTPLGLLKEAIVRRWESALKLREKREGGARIDDVYTRMWLATKAEEVAEERMWHSLHKLEDTTDERVKKIKDLHLKDRSGTLSLKESEELRGLEDKEVTRYWLREHLIPTVPLHEQKGMEWLHTIGDGAAEVRPYSFITTWELMTEKQRNVWRWYKDNCLLRYQHLMVGYFIPKKADLGWFKKSAKSKFESLFEDVDEEIYSEKEFAKKVKEQQAQLEDVEEELTGYDRFTVEEEKKIQKLFQQHLKEVAELQKQYYG